MADLDGAVVVVGGGDQRLGREIVSALLRDGGRVVVPVRNEAVAERFYLDAEPEFVPSLRLVAGDLTEPQTLTRIATVARREFGGIDHVVWAPGAMPQGGLTTLSESDLDFVVHAGVTVPAMLLLGLLRHLGGNAAAKRVVVVTTSAGEAGAAELARVFGEGLVALLRASGAPNLECYVLRAGDAGAGDTVGTALSRLLAEGAATPTLDLAARNS